MSGVSAQFPTQAWDGTSKTRSTADVNGATASPTGSDWDQMTAELIAAHNALFGTAWTSVGALSGSWTGTIKYKKRANQVFLTGVGTAGTKTDGTTICVLPSDARPAHTIALPVCPDSGGTGDANMRIIITSNGSVKCYGLSSTTTIDFSNVSFSTDQ